MHYLKRERRSMTCALKRKLKSDSGESLIEVLAAILVCVLALVILFGATMAAANLNGKAETQDAALQEEQIASEEWQTSYAGGTGTVKVSSDYYQVTFFGESGELISYKWMGVVNGNVIQTQ